MNLMAVNSRNHLIPKTQHCPSCLHSSARTSSDLGEDYQFLGISLSASKKDIKSAYFQKAKLYHPDNKTSELACSVKFQRLTDAYKRIMDNMEKIEMMNNVAFKRSNHPDKR